MGFYSFLQSSVPLFLDMKLITIILRSRISVQHNIFILTWWWWPDVADSCRPPWTVPHSRGGCCGRPSPHAWRPWAGPRCHAQCRSSGLPPPHASAHGKLCRNVPYQSSPRSPAAQTGCPTPAGRCSSGWPCAGSCELIVATGSSPRTRHLSPRHCRPHSAKK